MVGLQVRDEIVHQLNVGEPSLVCMAMRLTGVRTLLRRKSGKFDDSRCRAESDFADASASEYARHKKVSSGNCMADIDDD